MNARDLTPEQLEQVAYGLGIPQADDYADLVEKVDAWPEPAPLRPRPRSLRRLVADYALLVIAAAWMAATGGVVGLVVGVDKAGGK